MVIIAASLGRWEDNKTGIAEATFCNGRDCVGLCAAPVRPVLIDIKCPMSGPFLISRHHCVSVG